MNKDKSLTQILDEKFGPAPKIETVLELEFKLLAIKLLCIREEACLFEESPEQILQRYDNIQRHLVEIRSKKRL